MGDSCGEALVRIVGAVMMVTVFAMMADFNANLQARRQVEAWRDGVAPVKTR